MQTDTEISVSERLTIEQRDRAGVIVLVEGARVVVDRASSTVVEAAWIVESVARDIVESAFSTVESAFRTVEATMILAKILDIPGNATSGLVMAAALQCGPVVGLRILVEVCRILVAVR